MSGADCKCRRRKGHCGCTGAVQFIDAGGPPAWQRVAAVERGYREAQRAQLRRAGGACPSWVNGIRGAVLTSNNRPQPWVNVAIQISTITKPLLSIVYGGAVVFEPYSLLVDVLTRCDLGATSKAKLAEAADYYVVQSIIMGALAGLTFWNPVVAAALGACAACALVMAEVCTAMSKGRAPSVGNLLVLAGPLAALGAATGRLSPGNAQTIQQVAGSREARDAAAAIDKQTGASPVAATNVQEAAEALAIQSALLQAGIAALQSRTDPWVAFEKRFNQIKALKNTQSSIADGIKSGQQFIDLIRKGGGLSKGGGKSALLMAQYGRRFAQARNPAVYTKLPVQTPADVARWVDSNGGDFIVDNRTGQSPTATTKTSKGVGVLPFVVGALALVAVAGGGAAARRKSKKKEQAA